MKNYVMVDGQNLFDLPVSNNLVTYDIIQNCNRLFAGLSLFRKILEDDSNRLK